jgi:hypothetical protein
VSTVETNIVPQHLRALGRANVVRLSRARRKGDLAALEPGADARLLADWIQDPPPELESAELLEALMWLKRWGRARARRLLVGLGIRENKQLGTLTVRQAASIAAVLRPLEDPEARR